MRIRATRLTAVARGVRTLTASGYVFPDSLGLPTMAGTYSLRKMRSAYAGSCVRILRSSDGAQQDFGFTASNDLDVAAISTFIGAGNAHVVTWYDQSGLGRNMLSYLTDTSAPRLMLSGHGPGNRPYILYSGDDSVCFHQHSGGGYVVGPGTSIVAAFQASSTKANSPLFGGGTADPSDRVWVAAGTSLNAAISSGVGTPTTAYTTDTFTVAEVETDNVTMNLYKQNGTVKASTTHTAAGFTMHWIGAFSGATYAGRITEVTAFTTFMSAANRTAYYANIAAYWGTLQ